MAKPEKKVIDLSISRETTLEDLARHYHESGGFVAKKVGVAVNILE
ncbi:MAG: hypothetical protein HY367_00465, partial [Candidatus Aenigmarchaeota archaeon]|nr:hypothetical protein [Candidatus Aenigmarchaeota archaeon]